MGLWAEQWGQITRQSARIAAMLEYHSCPQASHLQGQRPSSSNMAHLRALRDRLDTSGRDTMEIRASAHLHSDSNWFVIETVELCMLVGKECLS